MMTIHGRYAGRYTRQSEHKNVRKNTYEKNNKVHDSSFLDRHVVAMEHTGKDEVYCELYIAKVYIQSDEEGYQAISEEVSGLLFLYSYWCHEAEA